ncbi:zinc ribbon domain-containing protein [Mycobacterium sp.]|uniref:zinc ribbon domain-containing protein n=1 Tax=Mycobacterium sp. TaxID=1785 RepID=UPI0025F4EAA0|nr:zinc ribbon domain-containing protein [Mycobacterium sp.]
MKLMLDEIWANGYDGFNLANKTYNLPLFLGACLKHFTYTKIEDKLQSMAEERGVHVKLQSSAFRSQRCFECGWVQKKNRKGKSFCCAFCGRESDSDINAAENHTIELPSLRFLVGSGINRKGFFWMPDGLYNRDAQEIRVPDTFQNDILYEKS